MLITALALLSVAFASPIEKNTGSVLRGINFPDPSIHWSHGKWWAFATAKAHGSVHIQVAVSEDYKHWELMKNRNGTQYDALPSLPSWVQKKNGSGIWAPDVVKLDDDSWVMYLSGHRSGTASKECLMAAKSTTIEGPYVPIDDEKPWICPGHSNGAFDVSGFKDWEVKGDWSLPVQGIRREHCDRKIKGFCGNSYIDNEWSEGGHGGKRYVVYKHQNPDVPVGQHASTPLTLQEVDSKDGVTLIGSPKVLLDNDGHSDGNSIEAPSLLKTANGKYVLFFSPGNTVNSGYSVSYATADAVTGPYIRKQALLKSDVSSGLHAPGSADIAWNGANMLFHAIPKMPFNKLRELHAIKIRINEEGLPELIQE